MTRLALAGAVLAALSAPAAALAQADPTLTEAPGSAFPDRQYVLELPSPRALGHGAVIVTENGAPISGRVGVKARTGADPGATRRYLLTYRSMLPPQTTALVRVRVAGLPAATASYTTPELTHLPFGTFEQGGGDGVVTPHFLVVVGALSALALLVYVRARPN
jgi:hypothetical protein